MSQAKHAIIQTRAGELSDAQNRLEDVCQALRDELDAVRKKHLPQLKAAIDPVSIATANLKEIVAESKELFIKPKTQIHRNIRYGFSVKKGSVTLDDESYSVAQLKREFPEEKDWRQYIDVKETVKKNQVRKLTESQLKDTCITVDENTDEVAITSTLSEADKFIKSILKENEELLVEFDQQQDTD